jgi:glycosyltransferase involved in cell wall biosynthesis
MADADGSYSFRDIPKFINKLKDGADLVVGNRFAHRIDAGVMPWHHKYIGNPFLSFLVKKLFDVKISDIHCGVRAITREGFDKIQLCTPGMEFASEMIIKASKRKLTIKEIPVSYKHRLGKSKLRSITDGLRHLQFIFQSLFY